MWIIVGIPVLLLLIAILFLAAKILLQKGGSFPKTHVSDNPLLRSKDVGCATSQDRQAQTAWKKKIDVKSL